LSTFARQALQQVLDDPQLLARALGEWLSEPKSLQHFQQQAGAGELRLAPATRMLYDRWHVFINGESFRASGKDARLMRKLADARHLSAADMAGLSPGARALLREWTEEGWLC
jgi:50S ribosomal protein L16 3-hydroxylase